eukprot:COSAG02_NODE_3094_length_7380_cov_2.503089_7_plen_101_part_00
MSVSGSSAQFTLSVVAVATLQLPGAWLVGVPAAVFTTTAVDVVSKRSASGSEHATIICSRSANASSPAPLRNFTLRSLPRARGDDDLARVAPRSIADPRA